MNFRKKISNKIITHLLKNRVNSRRLLRFYWWIYKILNIRYPYKQYYQKQRQHFIPQFLLKNFKISNDNLIYEYERGGQGPKKKSIIKKVALEEDYYTTRDKQKKKSNFIEKEIFAELLENFVPGIINNLKQSQNIDLTDFEESVLASFVAHQYTRTPAFREQVKNFILYLILIKDYRKEDLGNIEFIKKIVVQNELNINLEELIKFRKVNKATAQYNINGAENHLILCSLLIGNYIAEDIFRKNLHILESKESDYFFLSDNPVLIINIKNNEMKWPTGWDLKSDSIMIFLPISPKRCIFFCNRIRKGERIERENDDFVKLVNSGLMFYAQKFLYSHTKSDTLQKDFNNTENF